jgi:hypothetical protein
MAEVKSLAKALEVLLAKVPALLADDCKGYAPPAALAKAIEADPIVKGSLFTKNTVNAYIAIVIKL